MKCVNHNVRQCVICDTCYYCVPKSEMKWFLLQVLAATADEMPVDQRICEVCWDKTSLTVEAAGEVVLLK